MALTTTIERACANALATYLGTALASMQGGVTVRAKSAAPDNKLPQRTTITVQLVGPPRRVLIEPYIVAQTNTSATTADYTWACAFTEALMVLNVEARHDGNRDDALARLELALHRGQAGQDPVSESILLALGDGWTGNADFLFEGPESHGDPEDANCTFDGSFRGRVQAVLTVTASSARLATLKVRQQIYETEPKHGPFLVSTINSSGFKITSES